MSLDEQLAVERAELTRRLQEGLDLYRSRNLDDLFLAGEVADEAVVILREWMQLYNHVAGDDWSAVMYVKGDAIPPYYRFDVGRLGKCRGRKVTRAGTIVVLFRTRDDEMYPDYVQAEAMPTYLRSSLRDGETLSALNARLAADVFADDMDQMFEVVSVRPTREELEDACRAAAELLEEGFDLWPLRPS